MQRRLLSCNELNENGCTVLQLQQEEKPVRKVIWIIAGISCISKLDLSSFYRAGQLKAMLNASST